MMCTSCLNHIQDTKQSVNYKGHNICIHCILDDDVDKGQLKASIDLEEDRREQMDYLFPKEGKA